MKAVYAAVLFIGIFGALTSATLFRKNFFLKTFRNVKTQTYCARPSYPSYGYAYVKDKTCTYYCYPGYTLVGYKVRYCIDGQWKGTVPRCTELRRCLQSLPPPQYGWVSYRNNNNEALYYCHQGYSLVGPSRVRCFDGRWEEAAPSCRKRRNNDSDSDSDSDDSDSDSDDSDSDSDSDSSDSDSDSSRGRHSDSNDSDSDSGSDSSRKGSDSDSSRKGSDSDSDRSSRKGSGSDSDRKGSGSDSDGGHRNGSGSDSDRGHRNGSGSNSDGGNRRGSGSDSDRLSDHGGVYRKHYRRSAYDDWTDDDDNDVTFYGEDNDTDNEAGQYYPPESYEVVEHEVQDKFIPETDESDHDGYGSDDESYDDGSDDDSDNDHDGSDNDSDHDDHSDNDSDHDDVSDDDDSDDDRVNDRVKYYY
ncbi:clumping factor A-like [Oscarella lobularis]|uniref:clumping factor A-like n=1 Tax=Oscarella lobularis TaxID=121494 RepID=UPI00331310C1